MSDKKSIGRLRIELEVRSCRFDPLKISNKKGGSDKREAIKMTMACESLADSAQVVVQQWMPDGTPLAKCVAPYQKGAKIVVYPTSIEKNYAVLALWANEIEPFTA